MSRHGKSITAAWVFLALCLFAGPVPPVGAGRLPAIDWNSRGDVDWASGYVVGYGSSGKPPAPVEGVNLAGRHELLRRARRAASDYIYQACLGITIQENLRVRDYLREDPELRARVRESIKTHSPWAVRYSLDGSVGVAVRYPLGGTGLSGLLGRIKGWYGEDDRVAMEGARSSGREGILATGAAVVVAAAAYRPALRPRIVGGDGAILVSLESAGREASLRPAFIPFYSSLGEALADPVLGDYPVTVNAGVRGTDIVASKALEDFLTGDGTGQARRDVPLVIVRREESTPYRSGAP
jgi:hypothetical protein